MFFLQHLFCPDKAEIGHDGNQEKRKHSSSILTQITPFDIKKEVITIKAIENLMTGGVWYNCSSKCWYLFSPFKDGKCLFDVMDGQMDTSLYIWDQTSENVCSDDH